MPKPKPVRITRPEVQNLRDRAWSIGKGQELTACEGTAFFRLGVSLDHVDAILARRRIAAMELKAAEPEDSDGTT